MDASGQRYVIFLVSGGRRYKVATDPPLLMRAQADKLAAERSAGPIVRTYEVRDSVGGLTSTWIGGELYDD